jgi:uroporphyrinogen-III synthase
MPDAELAGRTIAITRPVEQARPLADLIRQHGGTPLLLPLIAIMPLENYSQFDACLNQLDSADWAIFISSNAVQQAMPRMLRHAPAPPPGLRFAAIGASTAAELRKFGIRQVLTPQHRYDSEHLLALPEMQAVAGLHILIFRGQGGRELLAQTLSARGAEVVFAECYRRVNPQRNAGDLARLWQNKKLHALVVTSSEALRNLLEIAGDAAWLREALLCVNHERIAELAQQHGLRVALAEAPGDEGMLQCLIQHVQGQYTQ